MKQLKIVFFGTPDFAATILKAVHHSHHQVVGVVTAPDKQSGRGLKIIESAVKSMAKQLGIEVYQPEKLRNEDFLQQMQALNADLFIVVAFRMMPHVLFSMPKMGTFNLHASLLPQYRGAAPINFAIINGETQTGVSTFYINEKIDEGHLLLQEKIAIAPEDNAGTLHDKLMHLGANCVINTLNALASDSLVETPQQDVEPIKTAYKIFKKDTFIDWKLPAKHIHDFVRGMSPYPCALSNVLIDGQAKLLKIYQVSVVESIHNQLIGSIECSKTECKVYVENAVIYLEDVQLEGKKRMPIKDFLNGLKPGTTLEWG